MCSLNHLTEALHEVLSKRNALLLLAVETNMWLGYASDGGVLNEVYPLKQLVKV